VNELTPEQRGALGALKASRGSCPSPETLVEYEALSPKHRARHQAHDHISICSRCQLALLHMAEPRIEKAPGLRWMLPLAAVLVIGVALTLVNRNQPSPAPSEVVRGTEIQPIAPLGTIESSPGFSWQSPARFERYRIRVFRGGTLLWQAETSVTRIAPPRDVIPISVELRWIVEGIDREGDVRMTSPPRSFTWVPRNY
jgi:hypothetical protein